MERSYTEQADWLHNLPVPRPVLDDGLSAAFVKQAAREADLLLPAASSRYLAFQSEYGDIEQRIALRRGTSYLGITNVALSRIRPRMGLVAPRARRPEA